MDVGVDEQVSVQHGPTVPSAPGRYGRSVWGRKKDNVALVGGPLGGETVRVRLRPGVAEVDLPTKDGEGTVRYRRTEVIREIDGDRYVEFEWFAEE